ncbi:hypothetical protein Pst134EA_007258 [Puccinia striiformis f. sp. tritici]|uniref:hypothetical protein n=1 Tax=Puccinia striiformis f. sp. tritici TaxID=168172 RepID=UPI00200789D4|nr:hypothetical protein Pst134EA_007258 [Puccinia striiformis f. sp. tritici]KAH9469991.1 hypothetical protein Pst134EA_007258 [Puccinia striiformis f. sp. tritici]
MHQIVYDNKGKLPLTETSVNVMFQSCLIRVDNPTRAVVTEASVIDTIISLIEQCPNAGAQIQLPSNSAVSVGIGQPAPRGSELEPYNPGFQIHTPSCHEVKFRVRIAQGDCIRAYESLSADSQGNLSAKNNLAAPSVSASYRSCRVIIVTTDGSKIRMKKAAAEPFFKRMVQTCDGKWAYMSMVGAEGPNGRTIMHTFSEVQTS